MTLAVVFLFGLSLGLAPLVVVEWQFRKQTRKLRDDGDADTERWREDLRRSQESFQKDLRESLARSRAKLAALEAEARRNMN